MVVWATAIAAGSFLFWLQSEAKTPSWRPYRAQMRRWENGQWEYRALTAAEAQQADDELSRW